MDILIFLSTMLALRETFSTIPCLHHWMNHKSYAHPLHRLLHCASHHRHPSRHFKMRSGIVVRPKISPNPSPPMLPRSTTRQLRSLISFIKEIFGDTVLNSLRKVSHVRRITLHKSYLYHHLALSGWILELYHCHIRSQKAHARI